MSIIWFCVLVLGAGLFTYRKKWFKPALKVCICGLVFLMITSTPIGALLFFTLTFLVAGGCVIKVIEYIPKLWSEQELKNIKEGLTTIVKDLPKKLKKF